MKAGTKQKANLNKKVKSRCAQDTDHNAIDTLLMPKPNPEKKPIRDRKIAKNAKLNAAAMINAIWT